VLLKYRKIQRGKSDSKFKFKLKFKFKRGDLCSRFKVQGSKFELA
jgi:hypothetical protein